MQPRTNQRLRDQILYAAGERAAEIRIRDSTKPKGDRRSTGLWKLATAASWVVTAGLFLYSVRVSPDVEQIVDVPARETPTDQQPELPERSISTEETPRQPAEQKMQAMTQSNGGHYLNAISYVPFLDSNRRHGEIRLPENSLPERTNSSTATYAELSKHLRHFNSHLPQNGETL
ncbi:hypothetical protein [Thalassoglobus neptunius]|uniref:hypothetical protein n=1 Tax=Thalassoglobus neptunius TaxID=1938619 RepID=UPI001E3E45C3|nr:hypothetical protein [Thalassoglobus neptunius]